MIRILEKGDFVVFQSGNFEGLSGKVIDADYESIDEKAIYGFLITLLLSNGKIGYIEKSGHFSKNTPSCVDCHYSSNGQHGCNRMMRETKPKIDKSLGCECAGKQYQHYILSGTIKPYINDQDNSKAV